MSRVFVELERMMVMDRWATLGSGLLPAVDDISIRLMLRVNLEAPILATKVLLHELKMKKNTEGDVYPVEVDIYFTASLASDTKAPMLTTYAATKAG